MALGSTQPLTEMSTRGISYVCVCVCVCVRQGLSTCQNSGKLSIFRQHNGATVTLTKFRHTSDSSLYQHKHFLKKSDSIAIPIHSLSETRIMMRNHGNLVLPQAQPIHPFSVTDNEQFHALSNTTKPTVANRAFTSWIFKKCSGMSVYIPTQVLPLLNTAQTPYTNIGLRIHITFTLFFYSSLLSFNITPLVVKSGSVSLVLHMKGDKCLYFGRRQYSIAEQYRIGLAIRTRHITKTVGWGQVVNVWEHRG